MSRTNLTDAEKTAILNSDEFITLYTNIIKRYCEDHRIGRGKAPDKANLNKDLIHDIALSNLVNFFAKTDVVTEGGAKAAYHFAERDANRHNSRRAIQYDEPVICTLVGAERSDDENLDDVGAYADLQYQRYLDDSRNDVDVEGLNLAFQTWARRLNEKAETSTPYRGEVLRRLARYLTLSIEHPEMTDQEKADALDVKRVTLISNKQQLQSSELLSLAPVSIRQYAEAMLA